MRALTRRLTITAGALALATACSPDSGTDPVPREPELRILHGGGVTDTVDVLLAVPLEVELRVEGAAGQRVRFTSLPPEGAPRPGGYTLLLCPIDVSPCEPGSWFGQYIDVTTDASGRARIRVRLGNIAGETGVVATAPALDLADTTRFTVRPGAAAGLTLSPRDSTAYVGAGYRVGAVATDRHGNRRPDDPVTFAAVDPGATISAQGTWTATSVGRARAVVRSGPVVDTARLTVPPRGTLAVFVASDGLGSPTGIAKVELDGSGFRRLAAAGNSYFGTFPAWISGDEIAFEREASGGDRIFVVDTLGAERRLTPESTPTHGEIMAAGMPDGSVVFSAGGDPNDYGLAIWRVESPGAMPARIGPNPHGNANAWNLGPSPDGTRIAYHDVNRGLSIMSVATGAITSMPFGAGMPKWSPDGGWILFGAESRLFRIRPDGTGRTRVGPDRFFDYSADWSPDGAWVIARAEGRLELIEVSTGETLPLAWTGLLTRPDWKP